MDDAPPGGKLHDRIAFAREHPVDPGERAAVNFCQKHVRRYCSVMGSYSPASEKI